MPLCTVCHQELPREDFSKVQLTKKPAHQRKCKNCADISVSTHNVTGIVGDGPSSSLIPNTETDANKDRISDTAAATISSTSSSGQHPGDHLVEQQHPNVKAATGIAKEDDDGRPESPQDLVIVQDTSINNTATLIGAGGGAGSEEEEVEDVTKLRETIAQLKKEIQDIRALPKQEHDDDINNNKNAATTAVTQPSGITTDAMEVMERTKQRMSSLEELAADAVRSLLLVQAQTTAELESLRSSLLQVQEERDALKLQVVSLQQKQQQQEP